MFNPRSLVLALYTHWDTVEGLVRLSREFAVFTSEQALNCIARVSPELDAEAQGGVLRTLVNAAVLQTLPRSSDLQLNAYVLEFVRGLTRPLTEPDRLRLPGMGTLSVIDSFRARQSVAHGCKLAG